MAYRLVSTRGVTSAVRVGQPFPTSYCPGGRSSRVGRLRPTNPRSATAASRTNVDDVASHYRPVGRAAPLDRLGPVPQSVDELIALLDLEEIEFGLYRARQPDTSLQRVFGGQVLAQALMAAAQTVAEDRVLHSLHGYFLRPGRIDVPLVYDVETVRDGGSFSSRRVVARQGGVVIFYLSSSFHVLEAGFEH